MTPPPNKPLRRIVLEGAFWALGAGLMGLVLQSIFAIKEEEKKT